MTNRPEMIEEQYVEPDERADVDVNGHLATGLFVGVMLLLLLLIYAFAG